MLGIMGNSAIMAQTSGRGGNRSHIITFVSSSDDPFIKSLSCNGTITIESVKDGNPISVTYSKLNNAEVEIQADADTTIVIKGAVAKCYFTAWDEEAEDYNGFTDLSALDISKCACLQEVSVYYNAALDSIDVSHNKHLKVLICGGIENLTSLDLAANTQLQYLDCNYCTGLTSLEYSAVAQQPSQSIANAISDATAADGTVYTDSEGAYYSIIADAATAKGWTIEQITA